MAELVTILIDGLTYASWLFIVALGLTLVFGVLKILNIAHGSFYALGAYGAATMVAWFASMQFAPWLSLVAMLLAAVAIAAIVAPLTERGLKYGLMFVGATFACLYFFELFGRRALHPMHYLLVGAALIVFYLLLLSLSEQLGFTIAYGLATGATTVLVELTGTRSPYPTVVKVTKPHQMASPRLAHPEQGGATPRTTTEHTKISPRR